jgi:hypothetical protein
MDTVGAPLSTTALTACSTGIRCLSTDAGWSILPHPGHVRLQANNGSSSTSSGNFFRPNIFCWNRYVPSRIDRCSGWDPST